MEEMNIGKLRLGPVTIPDHIVERWCTTCYLIVNWRIGDLVERIQVRPDSKVLKVAAQYLYNYAYKDEMPPEDIAPAIINLGEDLLANKPVQLRAGDYITIQNHIRRLEAGK